MDEIFTAIGLLLFIEGLLLYNVSRKYEKNVKFYEGFFRTKIKNWRTYFCYYGVYNNSLYKKISMKSFKKYFINYIL